MRRASPFPTLAPIGFLPAWSWIQLNIKTAEMLASSAVVISHRVLRMAAAGPKPGARDRQEFRRMGMEKLEAAAESGTAMMLGAAALGPEAGVALWRQWMKANQALITASLQPPTSIFATQAALLRAVLIGTYALSAHGRSSATRLAQQGLRPIHARATANARRLSRT